jgi:hypothetical protein
MKNITGFPVTHNNYLKSRLFLVDEMRNLLRKCSIIIEAPRRFGKTSVIKEFIRQETSKKEEYGEFNILFLELEGEESVNDFCLSLFKELLSLYSIRKKFDVISKFFDDTWNILASRVTKVGISEIEFEIREKTREFDFPTWKEKINPMIIGSDFTDTVDSLTGWLRTFRQKQESGGKYQFVFCGSINLRKTLEKIGISKRINDLEPFVIPTMKDNEARVLIESLAKEYGMEIDQDGIRYMVSKITDGSPYYGQILVKALRETREKTFKSGKLKAVYEAMLRGGNHDLKHFHSRFEDYLSPLEKECSSIILKQLCCEATHEKELYDLFLYERVKYEEFQSVVNRLIYEGYIMRDIDDNGNLRFDSPLLKDWWAYKVGVN